MARRKLKSAEDERQLVEYADQEPSAFSSMLGGLIEANVKSREEKQGDFENLVARDVLMAEHIRHEADRLGLPVVSVDADSLPGISAIIERHFASQLPGVC